MYGIPNMKLEKHIIDRRIELMEEEGVVFKTNAGIENKKQVQQLYKEFEGEMPKVFTLRLII